MGRSGVAACSTQAVAGRTDPQTNCSSPMSVPVRISHVMCGRDSSGATCAAPWLAQAVDAADSKHKERILAARMDPLYDGPRCFDTAIRQSPAAVRRRYDTECYNRKVRRFALTLLVALLALSASGVASLTFSEPCVGNVAGIPDDGACPPSCVTCGCCAQGAEPPVVALPNSQNVPVAQVNTLVPRLPQTPPGKILHVPKPSIA